MSFGGPPPSDPGDANRRGGDGQEREEESLYDGHDNAIMSSNLVVNTAAFPVPARLAPRGPQIRGDYQRQTEHLQDRQSQYPLRGDQPPGRRPVDPSIHLHSWDDQDSPRTISMHQPKAPEQITPVGHNSRAFPEIPISPGTSSVEFPTGTGSFPSSTGSRNSGHGENRRNEGRSEHNSLSSSRRPGPTGPQPSGTSTQEPQTRRQGPVMTRLPLDANMAWRGIPEGETLVEHHEETGRKFIDPRPIERTPPNLAPPPQRRAATDCTECIGFLLDSRVEGRKKQQILLDMMPRSSQFPGKTIIGLAEFLLPTVPHEAIKHICSQPSAGFHNTCVHELVNEMKTEGKRMAHLVEYFWGIDSKRVDILKTVRDIHHGCLFCRDIFLQLP